MILAWYCLSNCPFRLKGNYLTEDLLPFNSPWWASGPCYSPLHLYNITAYVFLTFCNLSQHCEEGLPTCNHLHRVWTVFITCAYVFANAEVGFLSQRTRVVRIGLNFILTHSSSRLVSKIAITPVLIALFRKGMIRRYLFPVLLLPSLSLSHINTISCWRQDVAQKIDYFLLL